MLSQRVDAAVLVSSDVKWRQSG